MDFDVKRALKKEGERVWTGCTQGSPAETVTLPHCVSLSGHGLAWDRKLTARASHCTDCMG